MSDNCVSRNYDSLSLLIKRYKHVERIDIIKKFIGKSKKVVEFGSGAVTPIVFKITNACDNGKIAGKLLKKNKWKGTFKLVDLRRFPYPYKDKEFEFGISEG